MIIYRCDAKGCEQTAASHDGRLPSGFACRIHPNRAFPRLLHVCQDHALHNFEMDDLMTKAPKKGKK